MARSEDEAREALKDLLPIFHSAVTAGVRDSYEQYSKTAHIHRTTTRRSIARDHIVDHLRVLIDGRNRIRMTDENQTTYLHVGSEYRILVKKCDEMGHVALNQTRLALDFQANESTSLFPAELLPPPATNLYLSYLPNALSPLDPTVLLICPNGGGYDWAFEIDAPVMAEVVNLVPDEQKQASSEDEELVRLPSRKEREGGDE